MSVFRIYEGGNETLQDWGGNGGFSYNQTMRDEILDPDGASAQNEITSIPSPLAQIDLVKTAFAEVVRMYRKSGSEHRDLDDDTIYHKMVSDALDVGQIFFDIDKYKDRIDIVKWDKERQLEALGQSKALGQQLLGETMTSYLKADGRRYNFDRMDAIYILWEREQRSVLGGTSPATLFFTNATPKELDYISFGEDIPFDGHYRALHKRDDEYVKYLCSLKTRQDFAMCFPELDSYLQATYDTITNRKLRQEISDIWDHEVNPRYQPIETRDGDQTNVVEALSGFQLYKKLGHGDQIAQQSQFLIVSNRADREHLRLPLVLPTETGNKYAELRYTTGNLGTTLSAPYSDQDTLDQRLLPGDRSQYPYLTIDDFLQTKILRADAPMNSAYYYYPLEGTRGDDGKSYLLPLTDRFFDYFTVEDLLTKKPDGANGMLDLMSYSDSVEVTLRIPIEGNGDISCVEYKRIYYIEPKQDKGRSGEIVDCRFTGFVMPLIQFEHPDKEAYYNVGLLRHGGESMKMEFYLGSRPLNVESQSRDNLKNSAAGAVVADNYLIEKQVFDRIRLTKGQVSGLIIPRFNLAPQSQGMVYSFAIDLGTSNTHIEYRVDDKGDSKAFDIASNEEQPMKEMILLLPERTVERDILLKDYLPQEIGTGGEFGFPMRTVLSVGKNTPSNGLLHPFMETNIPFTYDKRLALKHNDYHDNIKWGTEELRDLQAYIENLMLLIRNKVLLNGGDLSETSIRWFYPVSMSGNIRGRMQKAWEDSYRKYFGSVTSNVTCITEAEAPLRYHASTTPASAEVVNIDIGGGTTDVIYADREGQVRFVTSFGFAANTLFSVPFVEHPKNRMVLDYFARIRNVVKGGAKTRNLSLIFDEKEDAVSEDIASFLFSLKDNQEISDAHIDPQQVDFNRLLSEDKSYKILFVIFYVAIIYQVGKLIKVRELPLPRHITFTGNGSKTLSILSPSRSILADFTKLILEEVTQKKFDESLEIKGMGDDGVDPKTITCKGGLCREPAEAKGVKDESKFFLVGTQAYHKGEVRFADLEGRKEELRKEVEDFFDFTLEKLNSRFNYKDNFGAAHDALVCACSCKDKDILNFLDKGIRDAKRQAGGEEELFETPFFYAIKGVMGAITDRIANGN